MNYIFDFDGTLMDTAPVILGTMQATIEALGLPKRTEAECRVTIGLRLEEIPKTLFPECGEIGEEYAVTYRRLFPDFNKPGAARPFSNVVETIRHCTPMAAEWLLQAAAATSRWRNSCVT